MSTRRCAAGKALVASLALGLLAACGGDADEDSGSASETVTVTASPEATAESPTPTPTPTPSTQSPSPRGASGLPPRPGQDECVDVRVRPDGRYTVYEAGTAVVRRVGPRLVVGKVSPRPGWTSRIDDRERDEVEIEFRASPRDELDLEVEIDDGKVEVQICADDD